nr:hypothetical protein [Tanacetum cinerariifolium]
MLFHIILLPEYPLPLSLLFYHEPFQNEKLVQTLLEGHSILSLEGSLSRDYNVEKKRSKESYVYAVESQEYQMVCTRPNIAFAYVGMLDGFDCGLQTGVQVFVDFDHAMRRSIIVMGDPWSEFPALSEDAECWRLTNISPKFQLDRPKRTVKPPSRYENSVYSNNTVKNMSSSNNKGSECEKVVTSKENTEELVVNGKCKMMNGDVLIDECNGGEVILIKGSKDSEEIFGSSLKKGPVSDENDKKNNANGVSNDNKYRSYAGITVLVAEGSKKWDKTLCGYFVGSSMAINELRYNLRRMWSRHGFKDIVDYNNGVYFMKFHFEAGIDFIREPEKIPLWIKMGNVPLEAWTVNGISALASRVGKPLVMDNVIASMCKVGVGRIGFARVLVEVDAKKALPSEIEVVYKNSLKEVICKKSVIVCYDWKPPVCSTCCVFGHTLLRCGKSKSRSNADNIPKAVHKEMCNGGNEIPKNISNKVDNEGFTTVHNRKNGSMNEKVLRPNFKPNTQQARGVNYKKGNMNDKQSAQFGYQHIKHNDSPKKTTEKPSGESGVNKESNSDSKIEQPKNSPNKKAWSVHGDILAAVKRSA